MGNTLRMASPDDTAALLEFYAPFLRDTAVGTFHRIGFKQGSF